MPTCMPPVRRLDGELALAERHGAHRRVLGEHGDHDLGAGRTASSIVRQAVAPSTDPPERFQVRTSNPAGHQVPRHGLAHVAQPEERDDQSMPTRPRTASMSFAGS